MGMSTVQMSYVGILDRFSYIQLSTPHTQQNSRASIRQSNALNLQCIKILFVSFKLCSQVIMSHKQLYVCLKVSKCTSFLVYSVGQIHPGGFQECEPTKVHSCDLKAKEIALFLAQGCPCLAVCQGPHIHRTSPLNRY